MSSAWSIDHPETLLWRSAERVTGQRAERETELVVTWQPELDSCFRQEPDGAENLELFWDEERGDVRLLALGVDIPVSPAGTALGGRLTEVMWGDEEQVHRVRFDLTNFPDVLLPGSLGTPDGARWRGTIAVEGGPGTLRLDTRRGTSEIIKRLKARRDCRVLVGIDVSAGQLPGPAVRYEPMPPDHQNPLPHVVEQDRDRRLRHSQHVLLEVHPVGQLHLRDAQPQPSGVIDYLLIVDSPARRLSATVIAR